MGGFVAGRRAIIPSGGLSHLGSDRRRHVPAAALLAPAAPRPLGPEDRDAVEGHDRSPAPLCRRSIQASALRSGVGRELAWWPTLPGRLPDRHARSPLLPIPPADRIGPGRPRC